MTETLSAEGRRLARRITQAERRGRRDAIQVGALEDRALGARLDALERWAAGLSFDPGADTMPVVTANMAASFRRQIGAE